MKRYPLSVGLLVVLFSLVIVQTVQASSPFPPQLRDDPVTEAAPYTRYENVVLGARLEYPAAWRLTEDEYLLPTYGFTLADKSGGLVLRVGWVHEAAPEQMELLIARQIQGHPGLDIQRVPVTIAGYSGVMLAPLPGIEPVTCIYLSVEGRVYEIWQRAEPRSIQETSLVAALRFETPRQSLTDLALPAADGLFLQAPVQPLSETPAPTAASGCVDWPKEKFSSRRPLRHIGKPIVQDQ